MKNLFKLFCVLGISLMTISFVACSDDDDPQSNEANLTEMKFDDPIVTVQPKIEGNDIKFYVAYNATAEDLKELVPTITISNKATVSPASDSKVDFSGDPVKFTVTAEDGTKNVYTATAVKTASPEALIIEMTFNDNPIIVEQPVIDETNISFTVAHNATNEDLKELVPTITISPKATVNPASGSKVDFSGSEPVKFVVKAENGEETEYTVTLVRQKSNESLITKMTFDSEIVVDQPVIEDTNIEFSVKYTANENDLKELVPTIEISSKATVNPASGSKVDFSGDEPVKFIVTAEDGETKTEYSVKVNKLKNTEALITEITFSSMFIVGKSIIEGTNIQFIVSPYASISDLKELTPNIKVSDYATVDPASDSKIDFSKGPVKFTVTAQDEKNKTEYTVSYKIAKNDFEEWVAENTGGEANRYYKPLYGDWSTCNPPIIFMKLFGQVNRYSVTKTDQAHSGQGAARIETLGTKGGSKTYPKVVSGTLFTGKFITDMSETLNSTKFGIPYTKKPMAIKGYYKYTPGPVFHRCPDPKNYSVTVIEENTTDKCSINAILYEISGDDDEYLTGLNAYTSDKLVARAELKDGTAKAQYTPFEIKFEPVSGKTYDPNKKYRMAIICSSSSQGDTFSGAPESVLYVDDIEVISE